MTLVPFLVWFGKNLRFLVQVLVLQKTIINAIFGSFFGFYCAKVKFC